MTWNQTYGKAGSDAANAVVQTSDGGYALAGFMQSDAGDLDFLLIKTDPSGVVPEFPAVLVLTLLVAATTLAVVAYRKAPARLRARL